MTSYVAGRCTSQESMFTLQIDPQIIGVEDLELAHGLEILDVLVWHLSDFEQTDPSIVIDQSTTLDVRLGLVGHLHDELRLRVDHVLQNLLIHTGYSLGQNLTGA